jgi:hypothetical protein
LIEKPKNEWKIKNGRIIECIVLGCNKEANCEGLCWEHLDQQEREKWK